MNCSGPIAAVLETIVTATKNKNDFSHLRRISITFPRPSKALGDLAEELVAAARNQLVERFNVAPGAVCYRAGPEFDVFPFVRENCPDDIAKVKFFKVVYPMYRAAIAAANPTA